MPRDPDRPAPPARAIDMSAALTVWAAALLLALGLAALGRAAVTLEVRRATGVFRGPALRPRVRVVDPHPGEVVLRWLPASALRPTPAIALPLLELPAADWGVMAEPPPPMVGPPSSPGPPYP